GVEDAVLVAGPDLLQRGAARRLDQALERAGADLPDLTRGVALAGRQHPDHADVAAERDPLDPVLGLPPAPRPHRRAEPHHELGGADLEQLGEREVPELVQRDGHQEAEEKNQRPSQVGHALRPSGRAPRSPRGWLPTTHQEYGTRTGSVEPPRNRVQPPRSRPGTGLPAAPRGRRGPASRPREPGGAGNVL